MFSEGVKDTTAARIFTKEGIRLFCEGDEAFVLVFTPKLRRSSVEHAECRFVTLYEFCDGRPQETGWAC